MVHSVHLAVVVMSVRVDGLCVLVTDTHLPSSPLGSGQSLDDSLRVLLSQTNSRGFSYVEQLYTTDDPIEKGSVSVVYFTLLPYEQIPDSMQKKMVLAAKIPSSFMEKNIVEYAVKRLQWKIEYTNVVYSLLPKEFTLSQLQYIYEAILGRKLDKRNFRKKFLSLKMVRDTGKKKILGRARPAGIYVFKKRELSFIEIL